eukprot:g16779.t1
MTVTEMEVMAGYCTSGGMYLGGKPALDDLSKKIYECLADSYFLTSALDKTTSNTTSSAADTGHATACMHWRVDEFAGSTFQSGSCECKFVENEAFCSAWVCVQAEEVENCDIGGGDCYVATNTEVGLCLCDVENDSGLYCESWSCKQVDSEGREQYEEYHCQRESISGQYCEAWNGNVTASNKIEVVTCECVAERSGDRALQAKVDLGAFNPTELIETFFRVFECCQFVQGEQEGMDLALGNILEKIHEETKDTPTGSLVESARGLMTETSVCTCTWCKRTTTSTQPCWVFQLKRPAKTTTAEASKANGTSGKKAKGNKPKSVWWDIPDLINNSTTKTCTPTLTHVPPELIVNFQRHIPIDGGRSYLRCMDELDVTDTIDKARLFGGNTTGHAKVVAVGSHRGPSANSGHWTVAHRIRTPKENPNAIPKWTRFDDARVSQETIRRGTDNSGKWRREATVVAYVSSNANNKKNVNAQTANHDALRHAAAGRGTPLRVQSLAAAGRGTLRRSMACGGPLSSTKCTAVGRGVRRPTMTLTMTLNNNKAAANAIEAGVEPGGGVLDVCDARGPEPLDRNQSNVGGVTETEGQKSCGGGDSSPEMAGKAGEGMDFSLASLCGTDFQVKMLSISFLEMIQRGDGGAPAVGSRRGSSNCYSGWEEELEVQDSGAQDAVEVALDLELACVVWLPLRAVAPHADNSFDAIKMAVTYYSEDCVTQGYVFALFCGLMPDSVIEDFAFLMRQIKGTKKSTDRIQMYERHSATAQTPPLTPLKIAAAIQSCETPSAAEAEHPPMVSQIKSAMVLCRVIAAVFTAGVGILIAGVGNVYTGTDLPLFVKKDNVPESEVISTPGFTRTVKWFYSKGVRCHAWLYLPTPKDKGEGGDTTPKLPPIVLMGHGLGSQKDMGLERYAEYFTERGIASFVFDYRTFGGSDGMPRHYVEPWRHVEDYIAALDYIRGPDLSSIIDSSRIALWGTSFSGGHVLNVAAADNVPSTMGDIRAIVSQIPHLDGRAASKKSLKERGLAGSLKMAAAVIGDTLRGLLGMQARYVAIVGCDGDTAMMTLSGDGCDNYFAKHPKDTLGGWRNQVCARVGALVGMYSPIKALPKVKAPILFVAAAYDEQCPAEKVREAANQAHDAKLALYQNTHFDMYLGDTFQAILKDMGDHLEEHLKP